MPRAGIVKKVINGTQAAAKVAAAAVTGTQIVCDHKTTEQRRAICATCPENIEGECADCGCIISLKTADALESCPKAYWLPTSYLPGSTATGKDILDAEIDLRLVINPLSNLAQLFNRYHEETSAGCTSCRRRRWYSRFEKALGMDIPKMDKETLRSVRAAFPTYGSILAPSRVEWSALLKIEPSTVNVANKETSE